MLYAAIFPFFGSTLYCVYAGLAARGVECCTFRMALFGKLTKNLVENLGPRF